MVEDPVAERVPAITEVQMIEVDRLMVEEAAISLLQMMENAGRSLAHLTIERFEPRTTAVLAGSGGNGGGALVAARHLANRGVDVAVTLSRDPAELAGVPLHQLGALRETTARVTADPEPSDVVVDGLIGYSLRGAPTGRAADLIRWAGSQPHPVISLDTPSGIDVTTGAVADPAIRADVTMTLALPKKGLIGHAHVGDLHLADISVPASLYARIGVVVPPGLFDRSQIVRLSPARDSR